MANIKRLESNIKRALTKILREDAKDPDLQYVNVVDVELTNELSYLTIYYTVLGGEHAEKESVATALERSSKFIRTALAERVQLRKMPTLRFNYDETLDRANRIERGLKAVLEDDEDN